MSAAEVELRVSGEHAVLAGGENGREADPRNLALGTGLADALHEWARVAAAVQRTGNRQGSEVVSRRGRQLAVRVAATLGVAVGYRDPLTGQELVVPPPERPPRVPARERLLGDSSRPDEATPWGTGLVVAAFIAVFVVVAVLALVTTLVSAAAEWVAVAAAVVVSAGLAPSLWLGRKLPIVRWLVLGAAVGVVFSWIGVLVMVFGS